VTTVSTASSRGLSDNPGISDDRVSLYPEAARPFGFLNRQWEALKVEIKPGDELWSFCSPTESWQQLAGLMALLYCEMAR